MKKRTGKITVMLLAAAMLFGCGGSGQNGAAQEMKEEEASYAAGDTLAYTEENPNEYVSGDYDEQTNSFDGKKIIYFGNIELETKEYAKVFSEVEALIGKYEVIVSDSSESNYDNTWYSSGKRRKGTYGKTIVWHLRVPVLNFDAFVGEVGETSAHVNAKHISSSDMTKQYSDNETRIQALEVQQARLIELLEKAENVSEMLEIEDRLSEVRYSLQSLNNANNQIDYDVQYSDFTITLKEVNRYSTDDYSFGERVADSLSESLENFSGFLQDTVIFIIFALPFIALAALILFVVNFIRKKRGKEPLSLKKVFSFRIPEGGNGLWQILKIIIAVLVIILIIVLITQL